LQGNYKHGDPKKMGERNLKSFLRSVRCILSRHSWLLLETCLQPISCQVYEKVDNADVYEGTGVGPLEYVYPIAKHGHMCECNDKSEDESFTLTNSSS